jgi:hypothetical protein
MDQSFMSYVREFAGQYGAVGVNPTVVSPDALEPDTGIRIDSSVAHCGPATNAARLLLFFTVARRNAGISSSVHDVEAQFSTATYLLHLATLVCEGVLNNTANFSSEEEVTRFRDLAKATAEDLLQAAFKEVSKAPVGEKHSEILPKLGSDHAAFYAAVKKWFVFLESRAKEDSDRWLGSTTVSKKKTTKLSSVKTIVQLLFDEI